MMLSVSATVGDLADAAAALLIGVSLVLVTLAVVGGLRSPEPADRLHFVALVASAATPLLILAAVLAGGAAASGKLVLLAVAAALGGAVTTHNTGRALRLRQGSRPPRPPGAT